MNNLFIYILDTPTGQVVEKIKEIQELDAHGLGLTVVGMSIVFFALIATYILFQNTSKIFIKKITQKTKDDSKENKNNTIIEKEKTELSGELCAAIAMAIFLNSNESETKNATLTIKKITKMYSPWNSKIYMLRQTPVKHYKK